MKPRKKEAHSIAKESPKRENPCLMTLRDPERGRIALHYLDHIMTFVRESSDQILRVYKVNLHNDGKISLAQIPLEQASARNGQSGETTEDEAHHKITRCLVTTRNVQDIDITLQSLEYIKSALQSVFSILHIYGVLTRDDGSVSLQELTKEKLE